MKSIISVIVLLLFSLSVYSQDYVHLLSSNSSSSVVEFIPSYDTSTIIIDHQKYIRVSFYEGFTPEPERHGVPAAEIKKILLGVPAESGNTIQVLSAEFKEVDGLLSPVPRMMMKDGLADYVYEINENYNSYSQGDLISFGEYFVTRGLPVQTVVAAPVQFNPEEKKIRLYTRIVFRISYTRGIDVSKSSDDHLLKDAVINYETAKLWIRKDSKLKKINSSSVLASGTWYTFEAPEEGIYKIDRQTLAKMGIDAASVDPRTIKIYNNGGKDLPERVSAARPDDLLENAIFVQGEADGRFDEGDYILFYGRGVHFWERDTNNIIKRYYHSYSTKNLYWITSGGAPGKRMSTKASSTEQASIVQTTTKAYAGFEEDKSKLQPSGRVYLGDAYGLNASKTYTTKLDGLVPGSQRKYVVTFASRSELQAVVTVKEQEQELLRGTIRGVGKGKLDASEAGVNRGYFYTGTANSSEPLSDNQSILKFSYQPSSEPCYGYLDWFEIYYTKYLQAVKGQLTFYSGSSDGIVQYDLSGFNSDIIKVFDVNDPAGVTLLGGISGSAGTSSFRMNEKADQITKYIAADEFSYKAPVNFKAAENSDIHGITEGAEFIIITPPQFKAEAERLKRHKENDIRVKISTLVITADQIFNEFSGGIQDVCAVRDFIRHAYKNWNTKPEYVLLFGDGDYDYKNIEGKNQNFIIPYESEESYSYLGSYVSDDFFADLERDDGFPDIALGRLNILSAEDARLIVDKIIKYETGKDFGLWRNLITFVADDHISAAGDIPQPEHTNQTEKLANQIVWKYFDQSKIYLALYPTVQTAIGRRKPAVNKSIISAINNGTLILSYVGHGNPEVWAHEFVFQRGTTIPQLKNEKLFFLTAATCDFGRYDIPGAENQSSTELLIFKPDGGSIGAFTAARTVYSHYNAAINEVFYKNLLKRDTLNLIRCVGKSYYLTKLSRSERINDLKFHLFCDPTLRLAAPEKSALIDSVNGHNLESEFQVKALSSLTISGSIKHVNGTDASDFNGEAIVSVYDSERDVVITEMSNNKVLMQGGLIYRGRVDITNGKFRTEFTVPKDISYENKNGKISAYIYDENSDGIGFTRNVIIGGTDSTKNDGKGPAIIIGLNNDMSQNSYLVTPEFDLNIKLQDQTGLNTTGTGIGHKLEGILNGDEKAPIDFTNYFVGDLNSGGKSGVINYKFTGLEDGDYNIEVKAWDVFNNFSKAERSFSVVDDENVVLRDVYNYPNPFQSGTTFTFQHNLKQGVDVKINIYTVAGRKIRVLEQKGTSDRFVRIPWDGRDDDGNYLANGTYLYKVIVKSVEGDYKQEVLGKAAKIQ